MTWGSILLVGVTTYGVLWVGCRTLFGRSSRVRPLTVLGIAAVLGGLAVFGGDESNHVTFVRSDRWAAAQERLADMESSVGERAENIWESKGERFAVVGRELRHTSAKKWVLISLGSLLVISGVLLAGRGRARPVALKALTVLGLAAASYGIVTFVTSAARDATPVAARIVHHDRIVKNDHVIIVGDDPPREQPPAPTPPHKKSKRPHAKRPSTRPERNESTEELIANIPPRAGEIPVADELAKAGEKTQASTEPAAPPSNATESPVAATEPASTSESPAAPEPVKPAEQPAPADPTPTAAPQSTPEPAAESTPAKEPTPPPPPEPAATPSVVAKDPTPDPAPAPAAVSTLIPTPTPPETPPSSQPPVDERQSASAPASHPAQSSNDRPEWVEKPGKLIDSAYRVSVNSGLYSTVPECQRTLDSQMKLTADQYIEEYLGEGASQLVEIPLGYLRKHVKKAEYNEVIQSETVGPMWQIHALLEFDDAARADFQHRWHSAVVSRRLLHVGASTGLVLALLGTLYGYLRLDLRSGGTHKGQLQLAAALVALIVTAGALLVQSKLPF